MHKMCGDERKCAVMKDCFSSDELRKITKKCMKSRKLSVKRLKKGELCK